MSTALDIAVRVIRVGEVLQSSVGSQSPLHYRRRAKNASFAVGNDYENNTVIQDAVWQLISLKQLNLSRRCSFLTSSSL